MSSALPTIAVDKPVAPPLQPVLVSHFNVVEIPRFDVGASGIPPEVASAVVGLFTAGCSKVDAPVLSQFPALKVVATYGVGTDHVNVGDCTAAGVVVGNTPGVVAGATADIAFALLLAAARNVVSGHHCT